MTNIERLTLPVTIVIPVRNEASRLKTCLERLGAFQSIVVVDSDSTDETRQIAAEAGVPVISFNWDGKFPKKRNWVLRHYKFTTPWVMFLDADELVTREFVDELAEALAGGIASGYWLNYSNHFLGGALNYGVPQRKLALFRVGSGEFERIEEDCWSHLDMEVHEHPRIAGELGEIAAKIVHQEDRGLSAYIDKHNAYSDWEAHRYLKLRGNLETWSLLTFRQKVKYSLLPSPMFCFSYFFYQYTVRLGFMDGRRGFIYACLKLSYFFQVWAKIGQASFRP